MSGTKSAMIIGLIIFAIVCIISGIIEYYNSTKYKKMIPDPKDITKIEYSDLSSSELVGKTLCMTICISLITTGIIYMAVLKNLIVDTAESE